MKRNDIKDEHENAVINSFQKHIESFNKTFKLISRPEPPDAVVSIDGNITWLEITDAFFSPELAESITTHVADDKLHKPVPKEKRFCIEPDEQFSTVLENVIIKKYNKGSMGSVYKQYGSGILLVGVINPFSGARELANTEKHKILEAVKSKEKRFNEIYLYDVHDHIFHKLL